MATDLIQVDPKLLIQWDRPVPRYTSYPTAPQFYPLDETHVFQRLATLDAKSAPLSLYFHIPFCKSMCLFCGCSVVLNRKPERQATYFDYLLREVALIAQKFSSRKTVSQLHLGGGTPTSLTEEQLQQLMETVHTHFILLPDAEISIEIDPRTVFADQGRKLTLLKKLGFNRVSFGVQDLDPIVQEAVRRRQSEEMSVSTYIKAKELGFCGINIDLIYGLPHQTVARFLKTADRLMELNPDRIALYSYAKIPWLKGHQKAIPEDTLPSTEEKFQIYVEARARFMGAGYTAIGMDHFALPSDSLSFAYTHKMLTRNFQGYAVQKADDMIGFGLTSIGFFENSYFQNLKTLDAYQQALSQDKLPIHCGYLLTPDDMIRRDAILSLMCHFELDKRRFGHLADSTPLQEAGFILDTPDRLIVTALGRLFIRIVASAFDRYLKNGQFSRAV